MIATIRLRHCARWGVARGGLQRRHLSSALPTETQRLLELHRQHLEDAEDARRSEFAAHEAPPSERRAPPRPARAAAAAPPLPLPVRTLHVLEARGVQDGERPAAQIATASFLGGAMISWGGLLMSVVGHGCAGGAVPAGALCLLKGLVFPVGLSMVTLTGSGMLTADFLYQSVPLSRESGGAAPIAKVLTISMLGNLAGCATTACAVQAMELLPPGGDVASGAAALASAKCALPPLAAFARGVGANVLVCAAIFQAAAAESAAGKIASLWLPVTAFVALGLEHSVANMFLLPLGYFAGAEIDAFDALGNLVPVLAGNAAGALLLARILPRSLGVELKRPPVQSK